MVRKFHVLYCEEEHGIGDVTFPEFYTLHVRDFDRYTSATTTRRLAKAAGWKRIKGADYCPDCAEGMKN